MRVLIVDDHALVRSGISSLLRENDIEVVGEAASGLEAVEKTVKLKPDIVLMDIKMPGCNGLQATKLIKAEMPEAKIVMLTAFDDDENLFEAIKSGAVGYLLKNVKAEEFIELLSSVMRGEVAVSPWMADKIVKDFFHNTWRLEMKRTDDDLTSKEEEVLGLVAAGGANKEIASLLNISENTVKYHLRNIMEKLHFKNRAQVAIYATKRGLKPGHSKKRNNGS
jgi:DNA-binding NarL/FixJ family response regulator